MPLKEIYPKEEFWLKIHMKDNVWDDMDDNLLSQVDEFERKLNEDIYNKFQVFLRTGHAEVSAVKR